jgi:uncharacterized protein YndB with AHSA1/START domain
MCNQQLRLVARAITVMRNQTLQKVVDMEFETIERELHIEASPEVVFDVVSRPEHLRQWWPDEAQFPPVPGGEGRIGFGDSSQGGKWVQFTVLDAIAPQRFSFRWTHAEGEPATTANSLLVVFELEPADGGTRLRMTESGFRDRGLDDATVAAEYADHVSGWGIFLPRLSVYAEKLGARA